MQFVAKQMLGSQLKELQGATGTGGGDKDPEAEAKAREQEELVRQAREEAEQERKEKHMKFEDEREKMRQGIREKPVAYGHTTRSATTSSDHGSLASSGLVGTWTGDRLETPSAYNIKKKEEPPPVELPVAAAPEGMDGRLSRAKGSGPPGRPTVPQVGGAAGTGVDGEDDNPMVMAQAALSAAKESVSGFFSRFGGGK